MTCESSVQLHVIQKPKAATTRRMQSESYLLACQRYIELNPVRVGMVADPGQYCWSSYHANGLGQIDHRLTLHKSYLSLGQGEGERHTAYRAIFRTDLETEAIDDIHKALQLGMSLGNERFAKRICGYQGIRRNSGQRARPIRPVDETNMRSILQQDFGF